MEGFDVAVLHDYFIDRLVSTKSLKGTLTAVGRKARSGGGGIHGIAQSEVRGGNAVNLAHAAARLGLKTLLITHSDRAHEPLLRLAFEDLPATLVVKPLSPGLTVAFEERTNVMLGHAGGAGVFGPELLDDADWEALSRARVVASTNWAANSRGTDLLVAMRRRLGPDHRLFMSPADVRDQGPRYAELLKKMRSTRLVDWLSLNEYEAAETGRRLRMRERDPASLCSAISDALQVRVDVHTLERTFTCSAGALVARRTRIVNPKRLTGAGDVWDAASIWASLQGRTGQEGLRFANTAARLYVSAGEALPPTVEQVEAGL